MDDGAASITGVRELHNAAARGKIDDFKRLIGSETPFEAAGSYGETSMHIALGRCVAAVDAPCFSPRLCIQGPVGHC